MRRVFLLLILLTTFVASASAYAATALHVQEAWVQEAPPGATVLAAYLVIANPGAEAQTLVAVSSPDFAAVEIHTSQIVNGVASMTHLKGLSIPAQDRQVLAPGGTHLMLMRPKHALHAGDRVRLRLQFSGSAQIDVTAKVMHGSDDVTHQH